MLSPRETRFGQAALQTGFVDAARMEACWDEIPPDKRTPDAIDRRLARRMVETGLLTRWQAQQLLSGLRPQALRYDRYLLLDVLGQGGMGRVFLAQDNKLKRKVALKVLSRERMNNPRALARFRREARVGAQLQHENLVRIYDEGEVEGHFFLVMEFIEGKTAGKIVAEHGPLPVPIAARIARHVALGLQHAHEKGLVHRDVNPMNIIIERGGTPKLTDLGLAIDLADEGDIVTRDGATVGTFDYISPEQARSSRQIDIRTDIYSLGCSLYHMLAGRIPFPQPSLPEKLYAHQMLEPESLPKLAPGVSEELWQVIRLMLAKKPSARYATPGAVAQALRPFEGPALTLAEIEAATGASTPDETPAEPIIAPDAVVTGPPHPSPAAATAAVTVAITRTAPTVTAAQIGSTAAEPVAAAPVVGSDIFSVLPKIDLVNLPLSDTGSFERRDRRKAPRSQFQYAAGLIGGFALIGLLFAAWGGFGSKPRTATGDDEPPTNPASQVQLVSGDSSAPISPSPSTSGANGKPPKARAAISVHWLDDQTDAPQLSLQDAIRSAVNKRAEVRLSDTAPIVLDARKPLIVSSGALVIRAAPGAHPVLKVKWSGREPAFQVRSDAQLKLSGIEFQCEPEKATSRTMVIQSQGNLTLEGCTFLATGPIHDLSVACAAGPRTTVESCVFRGLTTPLTVESFAGTEARVQQSLFVSDPGGNEPSGWAIAVVNHASKTAARKRRLAIDRCTVVGMGLLDLQDLIEDRPIEVGVRGTVVQAPALLAWSSSSEFPKGLRWEGSDNRYALSGNAWVLAGSRTASAVPNAPGDPGAWGQMTQNEPGTRFGPVGLVGGSDTAATQRSVADFALVGQDAAAIGIDPARLGR